MGINKQGWEKRRKNGKGIAWNKGQKGLCSSETIKKLRDSAIGKHIGEKNGNWKGGITSLCFQIRNSFNNRQWRSDVFTRDNFTCQHCGKRGYQLEVHHLKMFSFIIKENNVKSFEEALICEELWNINNGITLCKKCHKLENSKQMKSNKHAIKNTNA